MAEPIAKSFTPAQLIADTAYNCDVSDARDHGIYSMCSMVLKLRNLYKWERRVEPWDEPESADLLEWIDAKEHHWGTLANQVFRDHRLDGASLSPFAVDEINAGLAGTGLWYGAGYGRSLKSIFFVGAAERRLTIEGCPVILLGPELAREMASPFAMVQDGLIIIRTEPLRFFLWDHIQELRSTCRSSFRRLLDHYGLTGPHGLDQEKFRSVLDEMARNELGLFIHHEVGEILDDTLPSELFRAIVGRFPGSVMEFVCRAVKDVLADTHPQGPLAYIVREEKASTLGLFVTFLDGLRKELFPEMAGAWEEYERHGDWQAVGTARQRCRERMRAIGAEIAALGAELDHQTDAQVTARFNEAILVPLGIEIPAA